MKLRAWKIRLIPIAVLWLLASSPSLFAADFKIKSLTVNGSPAPGGNTFLAVGNPQLNKRGDILFPAVTSAGTGMFIASDQGITQISGPGEQVVSGSIPDPASLGFALRNGPFDPRFFFNYGLPDGFVSVCSRRAFSAVSGSSHMNDSHDVVMKFGFSVRESVLMLSGGSFSWLACPTVDYVQHVVYGDSASVNNVNVVGITNSGTIALHLSVQKSGVGLRNDNPILLINGSGISIVNLVGSAAPGGGIIQVVSPGGINESGALLLPFSTSESVFGPGGLLLMVGGSPTPVAFTGAAAPGGRNFVSFSGLQFQESVALNNAGQVVFAATLDDGSSGIFRREPNGTIISLVQERTAALLTDTRFISINERGDGAVGLETPSFFNKRIEILFLGSSGVMSKVVGMNDPLPGGGKFLAVAFPQVNNKGEVLFFGILSNGTSGIFVASRGLETEFVDPVPDLLAGPAVTSDTSMLAKDGRVVTGIAADGAARVVVRVKTGQPGTVEFSPVDENGATLAPSNFNGFLSQVSEEMGSGSISVPAADVEGFGPMAFAAYHAPLDFATGTNGKEAGDPDRKVLIKVKLTTATGETVESTESIKIVRPPVVLVHGLWSSQDAWDGFGPLFTLGSGDNRFNVSRIDYRETNAAGFSVNVRDVATQLKDLIRDYKSEKQVAAVQADVVTHSMGGLLIRMLPLLGGAFVRNDNFQQGDLHKVINIATPHFGSELARLLRNDACVNFFFSLSGNRTDEGAVEDLVPGSRALNEINSLSSSIALHNVAGIASQQQIKDSDNAFWIRVLKFLCQGGLLNKGLDAIHRNRPHDLVVDAPSQQGAVPSTTFFNGVIHTGISGVFVGLPELQSSIVSEGVINLLNRPIGATTFSLFPPSLGP